MAAASEHREFTWGEGLAIGTSMLGIQIYSELINQWGTYFYSPELGTGRIVYVAVGLAAGIFILGTVWDGMAYDQDLDLLYIGTGNGSPWNRQYRSPGGGDNLYLSSIIALRPETGELVWHYRMVNKDVWDFDTASQPVLFDFDMPDGSKVQRNRRAAGTLDWTGEPSGLGNSGATSNFITSMTTRPSAVSKWFIGWKT